LSSSCPLEDLAAFGEGSLTEKQLAAVISHLSDLAALIDDRLTDKKRDILNSHLSNCRVCRNLVKIALQSKNATQPADSDV
jgi:hypothetical protein